jgi:hypothetical protein
MSDLQFDRAVSAQPPSSTAGLAVTCAACQAAITDNFYDVNGHTVCSGCRTAFETAAETPRGIGPLAIAAACGFFAALAGALIYYVLLAYANLEIGIVAILIGYMVGYSVRKGARGGGRRFQILAVALTYAAVALAYTPIVVRSAIDAQNKTRNAQHTGAADGTQANVATSAEPPRGRVNPVAGIVGIAVLFGFAAALPVLVVFSSFPSGLISAFIIFFGLRQAWKMTAAPHIQVLGPYRVGSPPAPTSA